MRGLFLFSFSALDYGQLPAEPARNAEAVRPATLRQRTTNNSEALA